jgi:uncharacterized protein YigA (DUF484 family)
MMKMKHINLKEYFEVPYHSNQHVSLGAVELVRASDKHGELEYKTLTGDERYV